LGGLSGGAWLLASMRSRNYAGELRINPMHLTHCFYACRAWNSRSGRGHKSLQQIELEEYQPAAPAHQITSHQKTPARDGLLRVCPRIAPLNANRIQQIPTSKRRRRFETVLTIHIKKLLGDAELWAGRSLARLHVALLVSIKFTNLANTSPQRQQGILHFSEMRDRLLALRAGNSNRLHKGKALKDPNRETLNRREPYQRCVLLPASNKRLASGLSPYSRPA
jgi:hypothetical protein